MFELLKKVEEVTLFEKGESQFWQEPYISEQLLRTHLNPEEELASRKMSFIEDSIAFITDNLVKRGQRIIDFGCGPGLYCQRLGEHYHVTGIDFSENSIRYATKIAEESSLSINYHCQDYLEWQGDQSNDLALLIYCDYGALSLVERQQLLLNIHDSLTIGGKLVLDVFSINKFKTIEETRDWQYLDGPGFWRQEEHLIISQVKKYPESVTLEQNVVVTSEDSVSYAIWYQYFNLKGLMSELTAAGFAVVEWFADVAGNDYTEESQTIAIVAEKK